jgi:hypothetical protein
MTRFMRICLLCLLSAIVPLQAGAVKKSSCRTTHKVVVTGNAGHGPHGERAAAAADCKGKHCRRSQCPGCTSSATTASAPPSMGPTPAFGEVPVAVLMPPSDSFGGQPPRGADARPRKAPKVACVEARPGS